MDKTDVSRFLHNHDNRYVQDSDSRWHINDESVVIELPGKWITSETLEEAILSAMGENPTVPSSLTLKFESGCKLLIDCLARIIALANQSVEAGAEVTFDFTSELSTHLYLDRAGFFRHLHENVAVEPERPRESAADIFAGQSGNLFEFSHVGQSVDCAAVVADLTAKFIGRAGKQYEGPALSLFTELIQNIEDHSESSNGGFAGLQCYGGGHPHIRTVVSDSGLGIANTIRSTLATHYLNLFRELGEQSEDTDVELVHRAFVQGGISRFGSERGAGLRNSHHNSRELNAMFEVRQRTFALEFKYRNGSLVRTNTRRGMFPMNGTHICFEFGLEKA